MNTHSEVILLTGATGFLGSHLLRTLIDDGSYQVVILKRPSSNTDRVRDLLGQVTVYNLGETSFESIFKKHNVSQIIHTATEYGRGSTSCYSVLETNLMFPISLIESAIASGVKCFINTDSYFNKANMAYSYLLNYSLSKKSLNTWLSYFSHQIKIVNVVLEHIYGPGDSESKFIERMIRDIAIRKVDHVDLTPGDQRRDFVYVSDVAKAYLAVLKNTSTQNFRFREYNVGTGQSASIRDAIEIIKNVSTSSTLLNFGAIPYRSDEIMNSIGDSIELSNLGWLPIVSLEDGMRRTIAAYASDKNRG